MDGRARGQRQRDIVVPPDLEATFGVTPIDETACLLSIVGEYAVPFRGVGVVADRTAMARVADATLQSQLRDWARAINRCTLTVSADCARSVTT